MCGLSIFTSRFLLVCGSQLELVLWWCVTGLSEIRDPVSAKFKHVMNTEISLAPDCSRLKFSPNKQSGKYNEMDPILIGTAVSVVSYTDFIALVPSRQTFVGREQAQ